MNYFITGSDTEVGKTYFTALLTRALRRAGFDTLALKPLCCGPRDDVHALAAAMDHEVSPEVINPLWFQSPTAPLVAAELEGRSVDLEALDAWFRPLRARHRSVLVEGAGGWLVPLTESATIADLAVRLQLPVLVVVANRLGCLNHTLLTIESIRARGLPCAGLVLNHFPPSDSPAATTNRRTLERTCDVPVLFELTPGQPELDLAVA